MSSSRARTASSLRGAFHHAEEHARKWRSTRWTRQTITVQAGSFDTDHYLYTDDAAQGSAESWVSMTVPGDMVKSVYTSKKNNQTAAGELIQIESGVTTALGSY